MTIAPLQIPGYQLQRDLDVSPLAQLPQIYRQAQQETARRGVLGALDQGARPREVAMRLAQAGDLQGALTLANLDRMPELTPAMKEYNLARGQGFPGSFIDFRRAWRDPRE
jgi:hypothetical protein